MLRVRWYSRFVPVLAALAAGVVALSCGGGAERSSITAPPILADPDAGGSVNASATAKQEVCHYDATLGTFATLSLTSQAVAAHIKSHTKDYSGACQTASCPCFTAADLAVNCGDMSMGVQCPAPPEYGLGAFCYGEAWVNLGLKSVNPVDKSCFMEDWDPVSGNPAPVAVSGLTDAEVDACKQLILNSPYYPKDGSCPL